MGRVLVLTGDGKGKTTAALGLALRAAGHDLRVLIVQFVKSGGYTGEIQALEHILNVELRQVGLGFVPKASDPRFAEHRRAAEEGLALADKDLATGRYALVILDEVCFAITRGLLSESAVADVIRRRPEKAHLVLTGRGATPMLIDLADTVTEMSAVKHAYDAGIPPTEGIEL